MRGILNILIAFLVIAIVFNYQFYNIKRILYDLEKDLNSIYNAQNIGEYYYRNEEYSEKEYYIPYEDSIQDEEDILNDKLAIINFENTEIESLVEIKSTSIKKANYYLLKNSTIVPKKNVKKDKIESELYIVQSNNRLAIVAAKEGISESELESGKFIISGIKKALDEDIYKKIKKENQKLYPNDCRWVKNTYISLE